MQVNKNNVDLHVQAMQDWYLRTSFKNGVYTGGGRIEQVKLFGINCIGHIADRLYQFHESINGQIGQPGFGSRRKKSIWRN